MLNFIDVQNVFNYNNAEECMSFLNRWQNETGFKVADIEMSYKRKMYDYIVSLMQKQEAKKVDIYDEMGCVHSDYNDTLRIYSYSDKTATFELNDELVECMKSYDECKYKTVYDIDNSTVHDYYDENISFKHKGNKKAGAGTGTRLNNTNALDSSVKYNKNLDNLNAFFKRVDIKVEKYSRSGERRGRLDTDITKTLTYTKSDDGNIEVAEFKDDNNKTFLFDIEKGCFILKAKNDEALHDYICNSEDLRSELSISVKDIDTDTVKRQNISDYLLAIFLRGRLAKGKEGEEAWQDSCNLLSLVDGGGDYVINHKNGDVTDNTRANLEIVTKAQNNKHAALMREINAYFPNVVEETTYQRGNKTLRALTYTENFKQGISCDKIDEWNSRHSSILIKVFKDKAQKFIAHLERCEVESILKFCNINI